MALAGPTLAYKIHSAVWKVLGKEFLAQTMMTGPLLHLRVPPVLIVRYAFGGGSHV